MPSFAWRWDNGLTAVGEAIAARKRAQNPQGQAAFTGPKADRILGIAEVKRAFANSTFIYGTAGPDSLQANGGGGQTGIIRAMRRLYPNRVLFDPGYRIWQQMVHGHQMMDMYYGMYDDQNDYISLQRNDLIGEFVHHVMFFEYLGERYNRNVPAWQTLQNAAGTLQPGWKPQPITDVLYGEGQTATKEISKIIRTGIHRFGGKIVFELKAVFGQNVFDPSGYIGDTDLEMQHILKEVGRGIVSSEMTYGEGKIEFQYGGIPVIPTRAHFLSNWKYSPTLQHDTIDNQRFASATETTSEFLTRVLKRGTHNHRMRSIWDHIRNLPSSYQSNPVPRSVNMTQEAWDVQRAMRRL